MQKGKVRGAGAALLVTMCSFLTAGCAALALGGASLLAGNEVAKSSMPPPRSLTAAALGVSSDEVTVHGKVDFEGNIIEGGSAHWIASTRDGQLYKCEYVGNLTNCVPS